MNIVVEQYVDNKTAKRLKDIGFDGYCHVIHIREHNAQIGTQINNMGLETTHEYKFCKDQDNCFVVPTRQMVCDWLREEKGIHIVAFPGSASYYWGSIYVENGDTWHKKIVGRIGRHGYDDVIEWCINFALDKLL